MASLTMAAALTGHTALAQEFNTGLMNAPWRAWDAGNFPTFGPDYVAVGDMDGDQDIDAVVCREFFGGPGLSVIMSNGDGTFADEVVYESPYNEGIREIKLADVDFDNDLDVLGTMPGTHGTSTVLSLWRNNGDGSLADYESFTTGAGPFGLLFADFTGDDIPDAVTANAGRLSQGTTISLLEHNGQTGAQAGFLPRVDYFVGNGPYRLAAADIDNDLDLDLLVGCDGAQGNAILLNDGTGTFGAPAYYIAAPGAYTQSQGVALADMNGDQLPDLLAAGAENAFSSWGLLTIRLNNGDGTFGAATQFQLTEGTYTPRTVHVADLNNDLIPDVILTTPSGRTFDGFNVCLGDGAGGVQSIVYYQAAKYTHDTAVFDIDHDNFLDVVTVANDSSVITVHHNLGDGTFFIPRKYVVQGFTGFVESGDIDNDGDPDILTAGDDVEILYNNGDGTFRTAVRFNTPINPGEIRLRDLNNDKYLDLLMGPDRNHPGYNFAVALNNGDGTFADGVVTPIGASQAGHIDAFDLDNDTYLDVVLTDPGPANLIFVSENTGNGTDFIVHNPISVSKPWRIQAGDIDHNGTMDLVTSSSLGIVVLPGNGDFTFGAELPTGEQASHLKLTDLDSDGNHDIVYMVPQDSFGTVFVATMLGYGDGAFGFPNVISGPNGREGAFRISNDLDLADMTGDGVVDVILTNDASFDFSIFPSNGDGTLQPHERHGAGYSPLISAIADYDLDKTNDIATIISTPPFGWGSAVIVVTGTQVVPDISLSQSELRRGRVATFNVSGAEQGERVYFLYSLAGTGKGRCVGQLGGLCIDLLDSVTNFGDAIANADGLATLQVVIPQKAPLRPLATQAVIRRGEGGADSVKSNFIESEIMP
ncbi:MAG: VCBS repeat-containing protein [Planctomycetes bacterium]|nr:VCBS repeat-containing protein [Planctomycetota bacterium]